MQMKAMWFLAVLAFLFFGSSANASTITATYEASGSIGTLTNINTGVTVLPTNIGYPNPGSPTVGQQGTASPVMTYDVANNLFNFSCNLSVVNVPIYPYTPDVNPSIFSQGYGTIVWHFVVPTTGYYVYNQPAITYSGQGQFIQDSGFPVAWALVEGSRSFDLFPYGVSSDQTDMLIDLTPIARRGQPLPDSADVDVSGIDEAKTMPLWYGGYLQAGDYDAVEGFRLFGELGPLAVPLPPSVLLLGSGLLGLAGWSRFRKS